MADARARAVRGSAGLNRGDQLVESADEHGVTLKKRNPGKR
jgi:hypothetical protein